LDNLGAIAWKVLFGDEFEDMPDINKPENTAYVNAVQKAKKEDFKRFTEGYGRVFFDQLKLDVQKGMFELLTKDTTCGDGNCLISKKIEEMQYTLKLISKAMSVIKEN
jgi:hypothetical protein